MGGKMLGEGSGSGRQIRDERLVGGICDDIY